MYFFGGKQHQAGDKYNSSNNFLAAYRPQGTVFFLKGVAGDTDRFLWLHQDNNQRDIYHCYYEPGQGQYLKPAVESSQVF